MYLSIINTIRKDDTIYERVRDLICYFPLKKSLQIKHLRNFSHRNSHHFRYNLMPT